MRLLVSRNTAKEQLVLVTSEGYRRLAAMRRDYSSKRASGTYSPEFDNAAYRQTVNDWGTSASETLSMIFPTELEAHRFLNAPNVNVAATHGMNADFSGLLNRMQDLLAVLNHLQEAGLNQYTDLPLRDRLYVEDIDSFARVRDVNPGMVATLVPDGFLDLSEDKVQHGLEGILSLPFHKNDWGGELCDCYTANVIVNGYRRATAFLLKGPGIGRKEMTIADCGKNGDQIVRVFMLPAELFIIQYVGPITELVIADVQGKVDRLRAQGKDVHYLIMDGQDTARVLRAYGKI